LNIAQNHSSFNSAPSQERAEGAPGLDKHHAPGEEVGFESSAHIKSYTAVNPKISSLARQEGLRSISGVPQYHGSMY
jgi:hypothetical protein